MRASIREQTLGVGTFSVAQRRAILEQLELLRRSGAGDRELLYCAPERAVLRQESREHSRR